MSKWYGIAVVILSSLALNAYQHYRIESLKTQRELLAAELTAESARVKQQAQEAELQRQLALDELERSLRADLVKERQESQVRISRLRDAIEDAESACLDSPLPDAILNELR